MTSYLENLIRANEILLKENPKISSNNQSEEEQEKLFRALRNIREPLPISEEYLMLEEAILQEQNRRKGIVSIDDLEPAKLNSKLYLYQGDITRLKVDAIVNAANNQMLGCFIPLHNCIDNAIHSAAGVKLREECNNLMINQGVLEPTGSAKITSGYNLPAQYVIHTVGPIVQGKVTEKNIADLRSSYESILDLAEKNNLASIALCCISTGVFSFPNDLAAQIAVSTVEDYLKSHPETKLDKIIFNVFTDYDLCLYQKLLNEK